MKVHKYIVLLLPILLSSCSIVDTIGPKGTLILFIILAIVLCAMLYLTFQKNRKSIAISMFAEDTQKILNDIKEPEKKIEALQYLIDKLQNDKEYTKNVKWKDTLILRTYLYMAAIYHGMSQFDKAIDTYTKVLTIDPKHAMSYYNRGSIYGEIEYLDKALADLDKAATILSSSSNVYNNRGLVYFKLKDYEKAIVDFDKALQLEQSPITYYNRANSFQALGKIEEAIQDYKKHLELDPENKTHLKDKVEEEIKTLLKE